jgi:hypothetical protein
LPIAGKVFTPTASLISHCRDFHCQDFHCQDFHCQDFHCQDFESG